MYEDVSGPLDLSVMLSSACKHDIIKIRTLSTCEFSVNELLLPKSLLENLEGEARISSNVKTSRGWWISINVNDAREQVCKN
jgi:hypothetical protein